jgi:hypothetical protein
MDCMYGQSQDVLLVTAGPSLAGAARGRFIRLEIMSCVFGCGLETGCRLFYHKHAAAVRGSGREGDIVLASFTPGIRSATSIVTYCVVR